MEEKSTQKSRSISALIIIVTLIAVSSVIPARWLGGAPKKQLRAKLDLSAISSAQEVATDSNNDGVISWKEVMEDTLHTSPATLEELKKIPVDKKEIEALNDPNNLTSSFAKNLYLAGAYFEKNNITDEKSKQEVVAKLLRDERSKIIPTIYTYNDIVISKTESKDSVRVYGNTIASLLENIITEKIIADDITSIGNFSQSKKEEDLALILKNKKRLDGIVQNLLKIPTPSSAIIFHISTINRITAYRDLVTNLSVAGTDPMRATLLIDTYPSVAISALRTFSQLSGYFDTQNIIFSSKEKGYVFTAGYNPTK